MPHLCISVPRIGPYHAARLQAAAALGRVSVLETWRMDDEYAWEEIQDAGTFERHTLFADAPARIGPRQMRERVFEILDAAQPDAVAITGWSMPDALAALAWCTSHHRPAILMSESQERDELRSKWREAIKRRLVRLFAAGLVGGQPHADYLAMLGMPRDRIFLGYDVVDNDHFHHGAEAARAEAAALRKRLGLPQRYFLASNRFVEKKNLSRLLDAFTQYRGTADEPWDLVLLGDGPLRDRLEAQCRQLGVFEHVTFAGFRQYDEIPAFYGLAGAFVHASTTEQWGLVVNEAMAAGLPVVVSSACGCAPDLVRDGSNGFTFEPSDTDALAQRMTTIATDAALREAMSASSREIISHWTPRRFGENVWSAVGVALDERSPVASTLDRGLLFSLGMR